MWFFSEICVIKNISEEKLHNICIERGMNIKRFLCGKKHLGFGVSDYDGDTLIREIAPQNNTETKPEQRTTTDTQN